MMLTRQQVLRGTVDEYELFAELVAGLDDAQWSAPSRCEGWEVRDVAAHVYGTVHDVLAGTVGQRTPEQEARRIVTSPLASSPPSCAASASASPR